MNSHTPEAITPELVANDAMLVTLPAEDLDITPGRGMLHCERCDPDRTAGGLHIPERARQGQLTRWRVLRVGAPGITQTGVEVCSLYAVGDQVYVSVSSGQLFELPGSREILCTESCVIAKVAPKRQ